MPRPDAKANLIDHSFRRVRRDFFPRWDVAGVWGVRYDATEPRDARCYVRERLIRFSRVDPDLDARDSLVIHEICHAVTTGDHLDRWVGRMKRAAARADHLGRPRLARHIREDAEASRGPSVAADEVYEWIEAAVDYEPEAGWDDVEAGAARAFGVRPAELLGFFPRCRERFEEAKQFVEDERALGKSFGPWRLRPGNAGGQLRDDRLTVRPLGATDVPLS